MDTLRVQHAQVVNDRIARRDALLDREREEGVDAPFMLVIYSLLAIMATAVLFWRLTRTLLRNEAVRLTLRNKVRDLDMEVVHRTSLQKQLQQVLDVSPSGIMSFRSIRDAHGRIVDFEWLSSNRMANISVGREDLVGKRLLEEMPENRTLGLFDGYVHTVEQGEPSVHSADIPIPDHRTQVHHPTHAKYRDGTDYAVANHRANLGGGNLRQRPSPISKT